METILALTEREQLDADGYVRLSSVIPLHLIEQMKPLAIRDTQDLTTGPRDQPNGYRAVIHEYLPIIDAIEAALKHAGFTPRRLHHVSVFTQSPEGARRYWHVDSRDDADDLLVLCYLQDTSEANGCLIVGKQEPRFRDAADDYTVAPLEGERLVPSTLGDLIVIRPQQPHAAAVNSTKEVRLLIRLWISQTKN